AKVILGALDVDISEIDLEEFFFEINQIALKDTRVNYHQTKPFAPSEEENTSTPMPRLELDELILSNIYADYVSEPDRLDAKVKIGRFVVELPEANLKDQLIRLSRAELTNSTLAYHDLSETAAVQDADSLTNGQNIAFVWPEWDV